MKRIVLTMIMGLALTGCVSSGNQILKKETAVSVKSKITEGVSTKAEVRKQFGSPMKTTFTDNGHEIWTYRLSHLSADAISYLPVIGLFGSSSSGTQKELVIMFNGDRVQKYSLSESAVATKTGLFN